MINKLKKSGEWKVHLIMKVNFMSSKDNDDKQLMHSNSNNIKNETNKIINNFLNHCLIDIS